MNATTERTRVAYTVSFLTALLVANVSGPQYVYPTFGTVLATKFGWSAVENSLVSTACFVGVSFSGPVCSWWIDCMGIPKTLRLSAILGFLGPFLLAQTYADRLSSHFGWSALYLAMTGVAGAAAYMAVLDSQSRNFAKHRGMSLGLTSASLGLCGLVFSQINDHFFKSEETHLDQSTYYFLIFFAVVMSSGMFLGSFILGPLDMDTSGEEDMHDEVQMTRDELVPLLKNGARSDTCSSISGFALLTHPIGFTLYTALFVSLGIGYVYLANIGQILFSLAVTTSANPQHVRNVHVSIFSFSNCASRAVFGTLSDTLKYRFHIHRLWVFFFGVTCLLVSLVWLVTMAISPTTLLPSTIVTATAYGIAFGISPATAAEFGTDVFAKNWGWLLFAPALGSQLFNVLFGAVYDHEARKQGTTLCKGQICFQTTFYVGILATLVCLVIFAWAIAKTKIYKLRP